MFKEIYKQISLKIAENYETNKQKLNKWKMKWYGYEKKQLEILEREIK